MTHQFRWHPLELARWAQWGAGADRFRDLLRPQGLVWPTDERELESAMEVLWRHYGRIPVMQALAGAVLAGGGRTPAWARGWCRARIDLPELGLDLDWETAFTLSWVVVPLALALGASARLDWCLVGAAPLDAAVPCYPAWWEQVADSEAQEAVRDLLAVLRQRAGLQAVLWPMAADRTRTSVRGASLGLPLYLGAWGIFRGTVPRKLLASGRLDRRGRLHHVAHLESKARLAAAAGFTAMLTPAPGIGPFSGGSGMEVLEVTELEQAEFLWETYAPECGARLLEQMRSVHDPVWLAANAHLVERKVLRWPPLAERVSQSMGAVLEDARLIDQWLHNLEEWVNRPGFCPESLQILLDPVTPERVRRLAGERPRRAFRLAQAWVSFANHTGRLEESRRWVELSGAVLPALQSHEDALHMEEVAANREFIFQRHNRYDFRPELPPNLERILSELQDCLEFRRSTKPGAVLTPLGRLLGTVTQNYGFCGPEYLAKTRGAAEGARDAFGGGRVADYREDWRRQFCYEVYALLDAGLLDEAERVLTRCYLEAPLEELGEERLGNVGPHEHTLLARFFVETGSRPGRAWLRWALGRYRSVPCGHPWQLWLLNAGFLMPDPGERERMWTRSVECCLAIGDTAVAMALMPLGELLGAGLGGETWIRETTLRVMETLRTSSLNREHFRPVLDASDWRGALEIVRRGKARFFPFSYR